MNRKGIYELRLKSVFSTGRPKSFTIPRMGIGYFNNSKKAQEFTNLPYILTWDRES